MTVSVRMVHASGDTFMSLAKTGKDELNLMRLDPEPLWICITEAGEEETIRVISKTIRDHNTPYNIINPDRGDIAFLVHHDARLLGSGGPVAIPRQPGPAREGGHGVRCTSFIHLGYKGEDIFPNGVHFVTYHEGNTTRADEQVEHAKKLGQQMRHQAEGDHVAIGSGDLNGSLPQRHDLQKVFDVFNMTTTAEETKVKTGTHGRARIDYVWTMDKDKRVTVDHMKVRKTGFNSDHDPIVVDLSIH